jgi:hypothetical protein
MLMHLVTAPSEAITVGAAPNAVAKRSLITLTLETDPPATTLPNETSLLVDPEAKQ